MRERELLNLQVQQLDDYRELSTAWLDRDRWIYDPNIGSLEIPQ
jgi:hypothetical protein